MLEGVDTDKIAARFKKGHLTVALPKKPEAIKPAKKIEVKPPEQAEHVFLRRILGAAGTGFTPVSSSEGPVIDRASQRP